mgnify:CR=1 FL=1
MQFALKKADSEKYLIEFEKDVTLVAEAVCNQVLRFDTREDAETYLKKWVVMRDLVSVTPGITVADWQVVELAQ